MAVFKNSRYTKTGAYIRQGEAFILEIRSRPKFNLSNSTYYTVVQGDTIDGIAYQKYGNAQFWWAIMDANTNFQSELEIKPGDILIIPDLSEVLKACGRGN